MAALEAISTAVADGELHRRLVHGDASALAEAYDAFAPVVHAVALRLTRCDTAAEDVVQEVFEQLWSRPFAYRPERGPLRAWLVTVSHHRAVDWVRREQRNRRLRERQLQVGEVLGARQEPGPEEQFLAAEAGRRLHTALLALPPQQLEAVRLAYFGERTYRQVAEDLGIPEGTAKTRLNSALRKLALLLGDGGAPPGNGGRGAARGPSTGAEGGTR